jgi:hypothetical protein
VPARPDTEIRRRLFGTRNHTPISRLVCGLLAGASLLMLSNGVADVVRITAMYRWPSVPGEVLSLSVEQGAQAATWEPRVRYAFQVDGKTYVNARLAVRSVRFDRYLEAQDYLYRHWSARYGTGAMIAVRYNPANPTDSILDAQLTPRIGSLVGVGALLPILALALAMRLWRRPVPMWTQPAPLLEG